MSDIKLTKSGDFRLFDLGQDVSRLYIRAFEDEKMKKYIESVRMTGEKHKLELKDAGNGCGDGVFCGKGAIEPGTVISLYSGTYGPVRPAKGSPEARSQDRRLKSYNGDLRPCEDEYAFTIIENPTSRYENGLKIDGRGSGRRADNVCCLNHSCDRANAQFVRVKKAGVYIIVAEATRRIKAGEQILVNYNGDPGTEGYWTKLSDLLIKHPTIPDGLKIIECGCNRPQRCPYDFARLVYSSRTRDPLAEPEIGPESDAPPQGTGKVVMAAAAAATAAAAAASAAATAASAAAVAAAAAAEAAREAATAALPPAPAAADSAAAQTLKKRKNTESVATQTGDSDAVQALLSLGEQPVTSGQADMILPWTSIPLKRSYFDQLDDTSKRVWLTIFDMITSNQVLSSSTGKPDGGFCGIHAFTISAEKMNELNKTQFPSQSFIRQKHEYGKTKDRMNEVRCVESAWTNACFIERLNQDGSVTFSYCPNHFGKKCLARVSKRKRPSSAGHGDGGV